MQQNAFNQIVSIQILRAVAALAIVVLHAFHDAGQIAMRAGQSFKAPVLPLGAGVDLFFVISGFVMVVASKRLFGQPDGSRLFLGRRVARIAPIYWVVTSAFLLIMLLRPGVLNSEAPTLAEIAKSYLFIPYHKSADGLMQPIYKLGWTLNYEMFFYLAFAVAVMFTATRAVVGMTVVFLALVGLGLWFKPAPGAFAFWTQAIILEFIAGMWIGLAWVKGVRIGPIIAAALAFAALAILALTDPNAVDFAGLQRLWRWGLPAALIIAAAALLPMPRLDASPVMAGLARLGDASYALYLCHPFVLRALTIAWEKAGLGSSLSPTLAPWAYVLTASVLATVVSLPIYALFEKPVTARVQGWLGVGKRS
ncbi:MAG: acyltransferase family protein [Bosea sp. (in: a-proteobacteria)]